MGNDPLTTELEWLTRGVRAIRITRYGDMSSRSIFDIKGLGAAVAQAKLGISQIKSETNGLTSDATLLVKAVQNVRTQIAQAHDDLQFEAEQLGNSPPQ